MLYDQFFDCGPDPSGATVETYNGQNHIRLNNFVNISTNGQFDGFITIGKAQLFIEECFIHLSHCNIFVNTYQPDNTESVEISNTNIVTTIDISSPLLTTNSVIVADSIGAFTFAPILNFVDPLCNYKEIENTCVEHFLFMRNIDMSIFIVSVLI